MLTEFQKRYGVQFQYFPRDLEPIYQKLKIFDVCYSARVRILILMPTITIDIALDIP